MNVITHIRDATTKDIPVLIKFQQKMALETEKVSLDIDILQRGIRQLFKYPERGKYYVAEEGSKVVGCLMTTFEWSDWRNGTVLWIQSVYINAKFRDRGVYRSLYDHIQRMAIKDPKIKGIRLYVDKKNKDAQQVYQKLGMNGDHYQVYEWLKQ